MARKIKTKSPGKRQRSYTLPERRADLDLCKIDTARIRRLSPANLRKAIDKVGPIYTLPERESGSGSFRWLLSAFMADLRTALTTPTSKRDVQYAENRFWPEGRAPKTDEEIESARQHNIRLRDIAIQDAAYKERVIWEMQDRAGCALRPTEMVARDIEKASINTRNWRSGPTPEARERADQVRNDGRQRTPYKGRKPIIR